MTRNALVWHSGAPKSHQPFVGYRTVSFSHSEHSRAICFLFSYARGFIIATHFHWTEVTPVHLANGAARGNTWEAHHIYHGQHHRGHFVTLNHICFHWLLILTVRNAARKKARLKMQMNCSYRKFLIMLGGDHQWRRWCATLPCWQFVISNSSILSPSQDVGNEHGQFSSLVGIYMVVPTTLECTATRSLNKVMRLPVYRTIWQHCGIALHTKVR